MIQRVRESRTPAAARTKVRVSTTTNDERGSAAIEVVLLVPALMLLLLFAVAGGRVAIAHGSVEQAAADAARAASIARTAGSAQSTAGEAARATLANQGLNCTSVTVTLDTSGFATSVGSPASVAATVSCTVRLSDLAVPGLPDRVITATVTSPLDTYRGRR
jgi:Flp pilus assembly protein TadG